MIKRFRILAVTLSFAVLLTTLFGCGPKTGTSVTFPDPNLEAAIREAINKPEGPIYTSDLEALTTLAARFKGISDLTGLEYCVNLERNDLEGNNISNLSALAGLTNLSSLNLSGNNITNLSPLATLTNLRELSLDNNNSSDISPLAGLTKLSELGLGGNNISDLSALAGLTNLEFLTLNGNNISDISPLVANSGLSAGGAGGFVDLSGNPLSTTSLNDYIPQLEAMGVDVIY
jgi:Leucine-rich repeat (LRR) protein